MRVRKSMKKGFDKARVVARKAVAKLPASTVRGYHDGRKAGRDFGANAPYVGGAVVGFTVGAGEVVIGAVAASVSAVFGWACSLAQAE